MSTFTIEIKLRDAGYNQFNCLETAMENENFILVKAKAFEEMVFVYYGNLDLSRVSQTVARIIALSAQRCTFSITKDLHNEKQFHTGISSLYRQSA